MLEELHSHKFVGGVGGMSGAGARSLFFGRQLDWGSREVWRGAMLSWFRRGFLLRLAAASLEFSIGAQTAGGGCADLRLPLKNPFCASALPNPQLGHLSHV